MAENIDSVMTGAAQAQASIERFHGPLSREYIDFLAQAYHDQFNAASFTDKKAVEERFRWKHFENPELGGQKPLIWVLRHKGRIAAQLCVMPVTVKIKGSLYKGGWCQDLIMLPELRNKGAGYFFVRQALGEMDSSGAGLDIIMCAGTNKDSHALLVNMGFKDIGAVSRFVYPLFPAFVFAPKAPSLPSGKEPYIQEIKEFGAEFDLLQKDARELTPCAVKKSSGHLNWRFIRNPSSGYTILTASSGGSLKGCLVLKEQHIHKKVFGEFKIGAIADVLFAPGEEGTVKILLRHALANFAKNKIRLVRFDILNRALEDMLKRSGFIEISSANRFLVLPLNADLKKSANIVQDRNNWHLTYGDSDLELS